MVCTPSLERKAVTIKTRIFAAFLLFFGILAALPFSSLFFNDDVVLLRPLNGAAWLRPDVPRSVKAYVKRPVKAMYRTSFSSVPGQDRAVIEVKARLSAALFLDGQELPGSRVTDAWDNPMSFDMGPYLTPGSHELVIEVENSMGVPVVAAVSEDLGIMTGESWEASLDSVSWSGARHADNEPHPTVSKQFTRADRVFLSELPMLLAIFAAGFALTIFYYRSGSRFAKALTPTPRFFSLVIMAALAVLAVNNFWKLSIEVGFDQADHYTYIKYVAEELTVPLATEGWSMFHSPLYYMISAPVYAALEGYVEDATLARALRLIPAASGVLMVEAIYRAAKNAFPDRRDLQSLAIVIGGLLPMNIYISRGLGNEILAALFSSCTIAAGLWILRSPVDGKTPARITLMGVFFGLALLSKVTAALLAPFVAAVIVIKFLLNERTAERFRKTALSLALAFGAAFVIAGWYYIRNIIYLGSPLVGNWGSGSEWWQFPSYRLVSHFLDFGDAFFYPAYSSMDSFWDSLYSTMWMDGNFSGVYHNAVEQNVWNHDMLFSGVWLGLLPAVAILIGIGLSLENYRERAKDGFILLAFSVALYIGAMLDYYLKVPAYTTGKATYTSGITVSYALLGALGLGALSRWLWVRAVVNGWISSWAVYAYGAYFILE